MGETTRPSQTWLQRALSRFGWHRAPVQGTGENPIARPTGAIASAESALLWISKVPGGHRAQVRIGVALDMIKGVNVVSVLNRFDFQCGCPTCWAPGLRII